MADIFYIILTISVVIIAGAILLISIFLIRTLMIVHSITRKVDKALSGAHLMKAFGATRIMDRVGGVMDFFSKKKKS